jgi:hypothetical protein
VAYPYISGDLSNIGAAKKADKLTHFICAIRVEWAANLTPDLVLMHCVEVIHGTAYHIKKLPFS